MFCYQCEQTAHQRGCDVLGICGKTPEVAALQDLLVHACKGVSMYAHRARQLGAMDHEVDVFTIEALFTTMTNVDFDPERMSEWLAIAATMQARARALYHDACERAGQTAETLAGPAAWTPAANLTELVDQGRAVTLLTRMASQGPDITGLQEMLTYGLKGTAAYAEHARVLGMEDDEIYATFHEQLDYLTRPEPTLAELTRRCLAVGSLNMKVMGLLDAANTGAYGHPVPTSVRVTPVAGKAIVVSGHDLKDLDALLQQTAGTGVNVYTHGEMLPAHGYPNLHAYPHLVGNYGGAWQAQAGEFDAFPGAILMTTNCIQEPRPTYQDRMFTSGLVAWPGVRHIADQQFAPVIEAALAAPGFAADEPGQTILVGFGHEAVLGVAGQVVEAVKSGAIRHFFLVGGCDGAERGRNYYTDLAESLPSDTMLLTLACGKYRFNKHDFGTVAGLPRLLDIGQCNDAYSAVQIAVALAGAFNCSVNELPLSIVLSWYEQKAVAVLLSLLSLGIKNIRLGPKLPAFVTPAVLEVLVDAYGIKPITTAAADLAAILS
jgi:hydroxylamine reductase